ncbi:Cas4 family exonuclease [Yersinia phage vB_YenM_P744]
MTSLFKISHSKAKVGRRCQMAYYYKYILKLKAKAKSRPLMIGSLVHESIESYIKTGHYAHLFDEFRQKTFSKLNVEEQALNTDIVDLCKVLVRGWVNRWINGPYYMIWVEKEFEIKLESGLVFIGKIDGRCGEKSSSREWLIEHKTCKRMPDESIRMYDIQTPLYTSTLPEIGEKPVTGVIWDYVRTKMPAIPEVLKSGELSARKNIDTLPEIFMREISRHGLNPKAYSDTIKSLNDESFYRRIPYQVSKHQSKRLREELIITSHYLQELETKKDYCRNLTRDCSWCDYKDLCYAELRGDDTSYLMKHNFEVRDEKAKEESRDIVESEAGE